VHTHRGILTIKGWGNPNHVQNIVEKIKEVNQKLGKIGQTVSQIVTFGPKHDIIRAQWASNILLKNMLANLWWCKTF
jgi:hypothetical protein